MPSVNQARDEMAEAHRIDQNRKHKLRAVRDIVTALLGDPSVHLRPATREKAQAVADELWNEMLSIDRTWD